MFCTFITLDRQALCQANYNSR